METGRGGGRGGEEEEEKTDGLRTEEGLEKSET